MPPDWSGFAARGLLPDAGALRFIFRAITPPGRTRRFDARFFLAEAEALAADCDDFSAASDELGHLHWLPLAETGRLDLPFITEIVLAEVAHHLAHPGPIPPVPFFDNSGPSRPSAHWLISGGADHAHHPATINAMPTSSRAVIRSRKNSTEAASENSTSTCPRLRT